MSGLIIEELKNIHGVVYEAEVRAASREMGKEGENGRDETPERGGRMMFSRRREVWPVVSE